MDIEYTLRCQYCQLGFDTLGDLTMHSCLEIKQESKERQDLLDKVDSIDQNGTKNSNSLDGNKANSFEPASDLVKVKMEETEEMEEFKPSKLKKSRKKLKTSSQLDLIDFPSQLGDDYQDLELSEEFLSTILKYVDDLCDIISNGDTNLVRTIEVNQNLNDAVNCYKNELEVKRQFLDQSNDQGYYYDEATYYSENDNLDKKDKIDDGGQSPKKKRGKYKKKKEIRDGSLSVKEHNTKYQTKLKKEFGIDDEKLFPYLKYDIGSDMFECCICKKTTKIRNNLFRHIKINHRNNIKPKTEPDSDNKIKDSTFYDSNSELKDDCGSGICRKLYGICHQKFWCKKCKDMPNVGQKRGPKPKIRDPNEIPKPKEPELCTECGKNVIGLAGHMRLVHDHNKVKCPHCDTEWKNETCMKKHVKRNHEKIPCVHCGKLIGTGMMNRHIKQQHISNADKRFKCEVCGKGFSENQHFRDHKNIHTGEKPYKCKYCSASFASRGNHAMHERNHLGYRRK